jgi:hypothetical protein
MKPFQYPIPENHIPITRKGEKVKGISYACRTIWGFVNDRPQSWNEDGYFIDRTHLTDWDLFLIQTTNEGEIK